MIRTVQNWTRVASGNVFVVAFIAIGLAGLSKAGTTPAQAQGYSPSTGGAALKSGIDLFQHGKYTDAILQLRKASQEPGDPTTALYYLALCYNKNGESDYARQVFETIVKGYPSSAAAEKAASALKGLKGGVGSQTQQLAVDAPGGRGAAAPEKLVEEESVSFTSAAGGHMLVNGSLNGQQIPMIFDTGASICMIGRKDLTRLGIPLVPSGPAITARGAGGLSQMVPITVTAGLGKISQNMTFYVDDNFTMAPLLGQTFFKSYVYDVDRSGARIHLMRRDAARKSIPLGSVPVPFRTEGQELVVQVLVNGRPCEMYLDTGASSIVMPFMYAFQLGINIPSNSPHVNVSGVGGGDVGTVINVQSLKLGPVAQSNVPIILVSKMQGRPLLGQTFLGHRRFIIDNEEHVIYFFN